MGDAVKNRAIELLKKKKPADFTKFFKKRAEEQDHVVEVLAGVMPTTETEAELNESMARAELMQTLQRHRKYLAELLNHDKNRMTASKLNEMLEEALDSDRADEQLFRLLQALVYTDTSMKDFVNYENESRKNKNDKA